jgi:hypothetical protein
MKLKTKRSAIAVIGATSILAFAVATPSFAHDRVSGSSTETSSTTEVEAVKATVAATITAVPTTVTSAKAAAHGTQFIVYKLGDDATAVPATQPTVGGKRIHVKSGTLTDGTLTGVLELKGGLAGTNTNYAIYTADGATAIFATVTVDATGTVATATTSADVTAAYTAPTAKAAKAQKGKHGKKHGHR